MTYETPHDLPQREQVPLDPDEHGRVVLATRIGGLVVYEVPGIETAQPATKPFAAVYELLAAHAPAEPTP